MTCVVGLVDQGVVYIGGDSAGVGGLDLIVRADAKVFRRGPFLFGGSVSFRLIQLLRYRLDVAEPTIDVDLSEWMATDFIDAMRKCLKDGGLATKKEEVEKIGEAGGLLVGYRGHLFGVEIDYQVGEPADGYLAYGCASQVAHGAMFAQGSSVAPEKRIRVALEAAERFSAGVRGPFTVLSTTDQVTA